MEIGLNSAKSEDNLDKLRALAKASNRADENLYRLSLKALEAYQELDSKVNSEQNAINRTLNTLAHSLYEINEGCIQHGVNLSPDPAGLACGYVLLFFSDAQVATNTFKDWPEVQPEPLKSTGVQLIRRAQEVPDASLRDALASIPGAFDAAALERDATILRLSMMRADAFCRAAGVPVGTGVPGLYG